MSLTPLFNTRGLWVKRAAEQLEKDNESGRNAPTSRYTSAAFRRFLQRSDNLMLNGVSRSKHSITHPDVPKRPRFTPARGRSKVTALLLSSRLGLMPWQALSGGVDVQKSRVSIHRSDARTSKH